MKTTILLSTALVLAAACSSPRSHVSEQDAYGNYVTTSDYHAMDRTSFMSAMQAGLADFERRMDELRERANELGGDALKEFSDYADELAQKKTTFENELQRSEATLVDDWPDQRERTLDAYYDLRDNLSEAYEDVFDEA